MWNHQKMMALCSRQTVCKSPSHRAYQFLVLDVILVSTCFNVFLPFTSHTYLNSNTLQHKMHSQLQLLSIFGHEIRPLKQPMWPFFLRQPFIKPTVTSASLGAEDPRPHHGHAHALAHDLRRRRPGTGRLAADRGIRLVLRGASGRCNIYVWGMIFQTIKKINKKSSHSLLAFWRIIWIRLHHLWPGLGSFGSFCSSLWFVCGMLLNKAHVRDVQTKIGYTHHNSWTFTVSLAFQ